MKLRTCWAVGVVGAVFSAFAGAPSEKPPLIVGVDANYSLGMETNGIVWTWDGRAEDLFKGMAQKGVTDFRVRLWTKDEGPNGKHYATEVARRALAAGMNPYLVIFLSEDWADMMKQPVPTAWKDLTFEQRVEAVRIYSRDIVAHFRKEGLRNHLYEIGNEIDYGICGEYPRKGAKKNPEALSRRLWPRTAELIRASQAGVLESDPDEKFMLHIAHWWDTEFCVAFFRFMIEQGIQVDYAGLSYFPSSNIGGSLEMALFGETVTRLARAINRPISIPETAYPSTREFSGQFSRWKYDVPGYPLTPDGQKRWIADFLAFCDAHPDIASVYYWSPEWCGEGMWKAFALFDPKGESKPAWDGFAEEAWTGRTRKKPVYLEFSADQLYTIPVEEAKSRMIPLIRELRAQTGGVTIEHIALLTNTPLHVGSYAVNLKASLQQNLSLTRLPGHAGIPLVGDALEDVLREIDPEREQAIIFLREPETPALGEALTHFARKQIEVHLHPVNDMSPLRFGMTGAFGAQTSAQSVY